MGPHIIRLLISMNILRYILSNFFYTESEQGVAQAIIRGKIDFEREPWPSISDCAKSLVRQMLEPDPKLRLTAKQVLGIPLSSLIFPCYDLFKCI